MANNLSPYDELRSTIKDPEVSPKEKVKRLAGAKGMTLVALAQNLGFHYITLFKTLDGKRPNRVRQNEIAQFLRVPVQEIWPDYMDAA